MILSSEDFIKTLDAISNDGVPYGRAYRLFDKEQEHKNEILKFKGYLALSDGYKCFFIETFELLDSALKKIGSQTNSGDYLQFIPRITHAFQASCGAERIALSGYPLQACTLLRNIYDSLILISGWMQGVIDLFELEGTDPGKILAINEIKIRRKKIERCLRSLMDGADSGLSPETRGELKLLDELFDHEVHGGRLSLVATRGWMEGVEALPVLPIYREKHFSMFMNRFSEVGWMLHRLIPLVQPPTAQLYAEWGDKWRALDSCFETAVNSLTETLGVSIGSAIAELVCKKFPYSEKSTFPFWNS